MLRLFCLAVFMFFAFCILSFFFPFAPGRNVTARKKSVQKGKCCGLAVFIIALIFVLTQNIQTFGAAESMHHLIGQRIQIIIADAKALHHVIHLGKTQRLGALEAKTFTDGLSLFQLGDKHHSHIFFASCAKSRLHDIPPGNLNQTGSFRPAGSFSL